MKIYTGTGDQGKTSLFSGERVSKGNARIAAYGDVDELNSILGALAAAAPADHPEIQKEVEQIQSTLFQVGAWLATESESPSMAVLPEIPEREWKSLETAIDRMESKLPTLGGFILPGGHMSAGWAHVARTVCRRAERKVVVLSDTTDAPDALQPVQVYLNRLSDYLFVLARYCNFLMGVADVPWKK
ncbi:ATP:Cob(I)alamin adenosyltransferase (EC [Olavius algarvensis associated proteobacterium Delta 3]|nr:ATP:Cob(I)alamin adenosyltransferase (EC [Olavius algarvensis associated proteobacterium Delta 3]CAB5153500.1 ATP:Cob(I)alamin adenosyltransferase (EC [Olavius algarvensis associated proteobacterium Delta 3]